MMAVGMGSSVAVAVDGLTTYDAKGKPTYAPRTAEEMQRIDQLVRSAVGFTSTRGDLPTYREIGRSGPQQMHVGFLGTAARSAQLVGLR